MTKMMELAREKQAAERKTLKETLETYACFPTPDSYLLGRCPGRAGKRLLMPVSLQ